MIIDFYMLCASVIEWIGVEICGSNVVTMQN